MIQNVIIIYETSGTPLLDALCDVTLREIMSDRNTHNCTGEKIPFDPEHRNSIGNKIQL